VHWQVALTGTERGYLAALIGSDDFRVFELHRDRDLEEMLFARAREFWVDHVLAGVPPEPITERDVSLLYPRDKGNSMEASADLADMIMRLKTMRADIKKQEEQASELAASVKRAIGANAIVLGGDGKPIATYKNNKDGTVTDWKGIVNEIGANDELLARFTTTKAGNRVLLLK
jgi:predicted phage-related endonuclease